MEARGANRSLSFPDICHKRLFNLQPRITRRICHARVSRVFHPVQEYCYV